MYNSNGEARSIMIASIKIMREELLQQCNLADLLSLISDHPL